MEFINFGVSGVHGTTASPTHLRRLALVVRQTSPRAIRQTHRDVREWPLMTLSRKRRETRFQDRRCRLLQSQRRERCGGSYLATTFPQGRPARRNSDRTGRAWRFFHRCVRARHAERACLDVPSIHVDFREFDQKSSSNPARYSDRLRAVASPWCRDMKQRA